MDDENVVLLCKRTLLSTKQNGIIKSEGKFTELEKNYIEQGKPDPQRPILHILCHIQILDEWF